MVARFIRLKLFEFENVYVPYSIQPMYQAINSRVVRVPAKPDFFNVGEEVVFRYYSDFLSRYGALVTRLLSQGYKVNRLTNTFIKILWQTLTDLVGQYKKNVCQMFADSIS